MRSIDYSENASLLDYEMEDWDTKHSNPTGINDDRMRLPTRYDIAKFYKRFRRKNQYGKREQGKWVKKSEAVLLSHMVSPMMLSYLLGACTAHSHLHTPQLTLNLTCTMTDTWLPAGEDPPRNRTK